MRTKRDGIITMDRDGCVRYVVFIFRRPVRMAYQLQSDPLGGKTKMTVAWNKDADAAIAEAKAENIPLLVDFSAAPT
jgi:hypothetical protein